jgi:ketosteroid isomerase-like protein
VNIVTMQRLLTGAALAVAVVSFTGCGSSSADSTADRETRRQADLYAIDQIEKNFHKATSRKDIDLMMSLWAPSATFTTKPGQTLTGKKQIRDFWLAAPAFQPDNHWISDTAAYKIRATVNGDRGTIHFECHYIDSRTKKVGPITAADQQVARINGRWLILDMVGGSATLTP